MTHRFPWSRLAEIAEAGPMHPVAFPTGEEVALLRRNLRRMRAQPGAHGVDPGTEPASKGRRPSKLG